MLKVKNNNNKHFLNFTVYIFLFVPLNSLYFYDL